MNIVLTLDYELYFGSEKGTVYKSIIEATERLRSVLDKYGIKAVFFVDVGFLIKLNEFKDDYPQLKEDYDLITNQLRHLSRNDHDLQLHIHPHWENSFFKDGEWHINTDKYKLSDWTADEIKKIVSSYKEFLEKFCSNNSVFAFRAGGWCIQPFDKIGPALKENNIWLDSTIFKGGYNDTVTQSFDFRDSPEQMIWRFENDPLVTNQKGFFTEIPISSYKVSPTFFWKLATTKLTKKSKHEVFGDGVPLPASKYWILKKLLYPSYSTASIDGFKASLLKKSFLHQKKVSPESNFVIIGHPKSLTEFSLEKLDEFIKEFIPSNDFTTFAGMRKNGTLSEYANDSG